MLDDGQEVRVEFERDELEREHITLRRIADTALNRPDDLIAIVDQHLATAAKHPAGITGRRLEADRHRPY